LTPEVLVGLEGWGWSKEYEIGSVPQDIPVEVRLWSAAASVTYFPGNTGFYLRGGVGAGGGRIAANAPPGSGISSTDTDIGVAGLAAVGYEAGITDHLAVGAAAHVVYLGLDQSPFDSIFGYGLSVQFNWYW
jgi:hypothetical protein